MHTISAFTANVTGPVVASVLPAVPDQVVTTQNNAIVPFTDRKLLVAYAAGPGLQQVLLNSPTLSQNGKPAIYPIDNGAIGGNLPGMMRTLESGLILPGREQISVQVTDATVGPQNIVALLWHTPAFTPARPGPYKTIPGTVAASGAGFQWNLLTLQLTAGLKRGRYQCVGLAVEGTNVLAARLVFPQQVERPGCIGEVSAAAYVWDYFRFGNAGAFGAFDNDNLPQLEVFGVGTLSGTINVYLDIIDMPM